MHTKAFYAGTFDPLTNGHAYIINESLKLFDSLVIGIGTNPFKIPMFSAEERRNIIIAEYPIVDCVIYTDRLMVNVANELGCSHIVRGIRNAQDLQYEMEITTWNSKIADSKTIPSTVFLPTPTELAHISSSMVKSLIGVDSWKTNIMMNVPTSSVSAILNKFK